MRRAHSLGTHHVIGAALIAAIGLYDGFFGPGTGSLLIFVFVRCYGYDFLHAGAAARAVNVATNAAALSYFASHGTGDVVRRCRHGRLQYRRRNRRYAAGAARRQRASCARRSSSSSACLILRTAWTAMQGSG